MTNQYNKDFYPTPEKLAHRMIDKVDFKGVETILEPSAGKGHLIEALQTYNEKRDYQYGYIRYKNYDIKAIEIEPELSAILTSKDIDVIDNDFLVYQGGMHFDLILANFPFNDGEKHLTKALDILGFMSQTRQILHFYT